MCEDTGGRQGKCGPVQVEIEDVGRRRNHYLRVQLQDRASGRRSEGAMDQKRFRSRTQAGTAPERSRVGRGPASPQHALHTWTQRATYLYNGPPRSVPHISPIYLHHTHHIHHTPTINMHARAFSQSPNVLAGFRVRDPRSPLSPPPPS